MPDIKKAAEELDKYRSGKAHLIERVKDNEQWYKLLHWRQMGGSTNAGDPEPTSAWLLNSLANKHADAMDNYPDPAILPRAKDDQQAAKRLSEIVPVILEQQDFEEIYDSQWWRKLKTGTAIYSVVWDKNAENGLGDVAIKGVDILSLYWEPGINDIQDSRNLFVVTLCDDDLLEQTYPQLKGKLGDTSDVAKYYYDENVTTEGKTQVVDWYYKLQRPGGGGNILHYCKYCGDEILYASEDDPQYAQTGYYADGDYPFVFDVQFKVEGSPAGFGWLDVCKSPQMYIDKLGQVILKNAIMAARPRWFVTGGGNVNEQEYADWEKDFVHVTGGGNPKDAMQQVDVRPVDGMVANVLQYKIDEMKETSGNRDFSQGGTAGGITAASAIAALQEAGSKLSRSMIRASYRAYARLVYMVIERIRQFYTEPREFRIVGDNGEQFVQFDNSAITPQQMPAEYGIEGMRRPVFDIKVKPQKRNAFSTLSQNEMAKEFYSAGFFNPQLADQALTCIEMMDFEGKEELKQKIQQNAQLFQMQQALMMQQQQQQAMAQGAAPQPPADAAEAGHIPGNSREALASKARDRAQDVASPK